MTTPLRYTLSEVRVMEAFHTLATSALEQAQNEGLLDPAALQVPDFDALQLLGPSLVLFFAALASRPDEPSVSIPSNPPSTLNQDTCPPAFRQFFTAWSQVVPMVQRLPNPLRFDLVRLLCNLPPLQQPVRADVARIAEMLNAVSMEITQRRSFLERYSQDLQQALDAHASSAHTPQRTATFSAPPGYSGSGRPPHNPSQPPLPQNGGPTAVAAASGPAPAYNAPAPSDDAFKMVLIRETLYAALADVFASSPSLGPLLKQDPPRAYFASVALAILDVARQEGPSGKETIKVVNVGDPRQPYALGPLDVPPQMRPIIQELILIGDVAAGFEEADTMTLAEKLGAGDEVPSNYLSRLDRLHNELEHGLGWDARRNSTDLHNLEPTVQDSVRSLVFRINALALRVTSLPSFQERANTAFQVLAALASAG